MNSFLKVALGLSTVSCGLYISKDTLRTQFRELNLHGESSSNFVSLDDMEDFIERVEILR